MSASILAPISTLEPTSVSTLEQTSAAILSETSAVTSNFSAPQSFSENLLAAPYLSQPQDFYASYIHTPNSLLLESAEMIHKRGTQSLIGVRCAVKVICKNLTVQVVSQNSNGDAFVQSLPLERLASQVTCTHAQSEDKHEVLTLNFVPNTEFCDESSRLKRSNPLDVLRLMQQQVQALSQILFTKYAVKPLPLGMGI